MLSDIKRRTRGATIPSINDNADLLKMAIPVPQDIEKQEEIARVLMELN